MKKLYFLAALCLVASGAQAQFSQFFSVFNDLELAPCPTDSTTMVIWPADWQIYQTTNGNWDGPFASVCISALPSGGGPSSGIDIDLSQVDPTKPLFLRARPDALATLSALEVNQTYTIEVFAGISTGSSAGVLHYGTDCNQDICTGSIVGIGVPGDVRYHTGQFIDDWLEMHACFPTEYFPSQFLSQIVLKFEFEPGADLSDVVLDLSSLNLSPTSFPPDLISEVVAFPFNYNNVTNSYDVPVYQAGTGGFSGLYLMQYTEPTFPSVANPSFVEATVSPNTPDPQIINLQVFPGETLEIQPFTYLIGGLVEGSDSIRHQANLVNDGGDICFNFIDLVFDAGSEFRHRSGSLSMNNAFSCMKFLGGSALRVHEGSTLHYGNAGTGMLALCAGSSIVLERDATLLVDAILNLYECDAAAPPAQLYMDLPPGARLIFTENARATNRFSHGQEMRLNVRMLGGTIDDTALLPEDRAVIRRVYPEAPPELEENVKLWPNPVLGSACRLEYTASETETVQLQWTDARGRRIGEEKRLAQPGVNEWLCSVPKLAGVYFVTLRTPDGRSVTKRVIVV